MMPASRNQEMVGRERRAWAEGAHEREIELSQRYPDQGGRVAYRLGGRESSPGHHAREDGAGACEGDVV